MNVEELDPGIRNVVKFISDMGYHTTDSGDGVTKVGEGVLPFPHVVVTVPSDRLIRDCNTIMCELEAMEFGDEIEYGVEGSYCPHVRVATIMVWGLNDTMLASSPLLIESDLDKSKKD